jgi:YHS domain-containing protein
MMQSGLTKNSVSGKTVQEIDDEMIKDPVCDIYFPKKDGVHLRFNGKDHYFCSTACRDKFVNLHAKET